MNASPPSSHPWTMPSPGWLMALILGGTFSLATSLMLWFQNWSGNRLEAENFIDVILGDSRRLFAEQFFVEADVYLHSGFYPSIFDQIKPTGKLKISSSTETPDAAEHHETEEEHNKEGHHHDDKDDLPEFMGAPKNWVERFGRNFYPSEHRHLESKKDTAEVLPWLLMAAKLDPHRIETFTVTAYWLQKRLGRLEDAEKFLHEGLRANPDSVELLFELGRTYYAGSHDLVKARNLLEAALQKWRDQEAKQAQPDPMLLSKILTFLADLEEKEGHNEQTIHYLKLLKTRSPFPEIIQQRIDQLSLAKAGGASPLNTPQK